MARVIQCHKTGDPEVLQIDEVDIGAPGPGELRLRVHAFGLNRAEAFRDDIYRRYLALRSVHALRDECEDQEQAPKCGPTAPNMGVRSSPVGTLSDSSDPA
jgi:hypothetical protein